MFESGIETTCGKHCINWRSTTAVSNLWLVYTVAGIASGRAYRRLIWGFGFAPLIISRGNSYRIIYSACACGDLVDGHLCINGGGGVYWPSCLADENGQPGGGGDGPIGAVFTFIASGLPALHGENRCGAPGGYGIARLTSELVLLFLYVGVIAPVARLRRPSSGGRAAGIPVLIGVVNLPIIHYSVEWWNTLHQGSTRMQQSIDPAMRSPLRWSILASCSCCYADADADA